MTESPNDLMWQEFKPLWTSMNTAGTGLLVAGGYGLLLKQHWLVSNINVPIIVPLAQWNEITPRVTKDLDIVVGLDIISSATSQKMMTYALESRNFTVKDPRWQFEKVLNAERSIILDLHSALPTPPHPNLQMDKLRVKHKPSLGDNGIHGRQNPEAIGCDLHPFQFAIEGVEILVPNPVSWSVMKLIAMRDRWVKGEDQNREEEDRTFHRDQAIKHARDLFRVIAMTTREERDKAVEVKAAINTHPSFMDAIAIQKQFFGDRNRWGSLVVSTAWQGNDFELVQGMLENWYSN